MATIISLFKEGGIFSWGLSFFLAILLTGLLKGALQTLIVYLKKISEKTVSKWDDIFVEGLSKTKGILIFVWIFFLLIRIFETHDSLIKFSQNLFIISVLMQLWIWGFHLIHHWKEDVLQRRLSTDASSAAAIGLLYTTIQSIFFISIILIGLSNLGIDIGALLAGLGVGGIAVALAAQNVLGDLLASLSIVLDKPFVLGDFIVVGNEKGTIEHIGLKTTRMRSISGEELIFSNKDLLESRIQNFKRMWKRRLVNNFGIVYATPIEQIEKIPLWIIEIISKYPELTLDRCNFINFGSSSLDFEYVIWMNSPDYNQYLEIQQKVNLDIMRKFKNENIEFAYKTQTLHITQTALVAEPKAL
jgi:small-conductance mechanosensitive channel